MKPALKEIADNKTSFGKLLSVRDNLVPFIGAGFSCPICPGWRMFLNDYFTSISSEFLTEQDRQDYKIIQSTNNPDRFEKMADFLAGKSGRRKFAEQLQKSFGQSCPLDQQQNFHLLHQVFPGLKITTNYDQLIENNHPNGTNVEIARGNRPEDLERLFTSNKTSCLLKIHGGLNDMQSIVLSSQHYQTLYGAEQGFDHEVPLPAFLKRLFTNSSVLFIGCSLEHDRVLAVLQSLDYVRPHFALMKRPGPHDEDEVVAINRRLSKFQITPIWFNEYAEITELLQCLQPVSITEHTEEPVHTFIGRQQELNQIEQALRRNQGNVQMISGRLFNIEGAGGVGKTTLALTAAQRYGHLAEHGVLGPFRADEMNAPSFAVALARKLDINIEAPADEQSAQQLITHLLKDRHCLIILDNAIDWQSLRYMLPKQSRATIIVTTRDRDMGTRVRSHFQHAMKVAEIQLHHFTPDEALDLFRELLMDNYRQQDQALYARIAKELGYLPIALRQAIALMKYTPHYSAAQLVEKLANDGRLAVLRKGQAADDSDERSIDAIFDLASPMLSEEMLNALQFLAICAPGPIPLSFLQRLSQNQSIQDILEQLHTYSWCERRTSEQDEQERHYELHQLVRELIIERFDRTYSEAFLDTVEAVFLDESVHFTVKDDLIAQLSEALLRAKENKDQRLKSWLYKLYVYCTYRGHLHLYFQLTDIVQQLFSDDKKIFSAALCNQALILADWGKLEDAMALHQKEQAHCETLGDQEGLARSYGNQALILKAWGKLEDAMDLLQKQQALRETLGDQAGLARSYGNQALILKAWGKLEDAMALHQKEQALCETLGDQEGLAACYGNQALILNAWGKLEDAMALLQKVQALFETLGDQVGLEISFWNQGVIHGKLGNQHKQIELLQRSIKINQSIGIPTEEYEKALKQLLD